MNLNGYELVTLQVVLDERLKASLDRLQKAKELGLEAPAQVWTEDVAAVRSIISKLARVPISGDMSYSRGSE